MVDIKPFKGLRPRLDLVEKVAALPYDVSSEEEVKSKRVNPYSFYHITRSEIDITTGARLDSEEVYQKAKENLQRFIAEGTLVQDEKECYYLYAITMNGRTQTGLVCVSSLSDYENGVIKKHEFTRPNRVLDRVNNILATQSHNGLVFLAYKENATLSELFAQWKSEHQAEYDFVAEDGVGHTFWVINDEKTIEVIGQTFCEKVDSTYVADGHHRSAAAFEAAKKMENSGDKTNYYLTCIFPDTEVQIMDYNRIVHDLNGNCPEDILRYLTRDFDVICQETAYQPVQEHEFGMYLAGKWYCLKAKPGTYNENDAISVLDVSILQENVLAPLFNITDPRLDERLDFVGGIRGLSYLQDQVDSGKAAVAFSCFPVTMKALFEVSDNGNVMPPKSTWFEPKTRDGLVIHLIS